MKKVFFLILVIASFSLSLKAQGFDFVSARQAHAFLVSEVPNLYEDYELIGVGAISVPMFGIEVDFETGNSQIWGFSFKSKDTDDKNVYDYSISSTGGQFSYELDVSEDEFVHDVPAIANTWKNSTEFADAYSNSSTLTAELS